MFVFGSFGLILSLLWVGFSGQVSAEERRTVIVLDGHWQIAEGSWQEKPKNFAHWVPVPGLVDLSNPPFVEVGTQESRKHREAFWYRRVFRLEGPKPPLIRLKINKAKYGKKVYVNGHYVGEHWPCFTACVFDITPFVRADGAENEILIAVGADPQQLPSGVANGWDFEKIRYIPGIYDSVMVFLSGEPHIVRAQAVPEIVSQLVRFYVVLRATRESTNSPVEVRVFEVSSGRLVGQASLPEVQVPAGQDVEVELPVSLHPCRLWSPEDPFLYLAIISTKGDTLQQRFGMREFRFDPETRRPLLNGRVYYLRGTNVCIFRFFEDPLRGSLPWQEDWVRRLHWVFKSMHWNGMRYCIGFPPEKWYDIADEVGLLIQDEFPIWYLRNWPKDLTWQNLAQEYGEWIQERWNHPSVIIWDAQNESMTEETGRAIQAVRHLDRSQRPWDNGWGAPQSPTDVFESHPYPFASSRGQPSRFRLGQLADKPREPDVEGGIRGNTIPNKGRNPVIINEYGWLWLNRDGSPTTLSQANYDALLGPEASGDQRRELYARYIAVMTEFWRSGRLVAGVFHFCGLSYSRPGGETSDNFIDIESLTLEPFFARFVRDAFAPRIAILDFWSEQLSPGAFLEVPVIVLNDESEEFSGTVRLLLRQGGREVVVDEANCSVPGAGTIRLMFKVSVPEDVGIYELIAELLVPEGEHVHSVRQFRVLGSSDSKTQP